MNHRISTLLILLFTLSGHVYGQGIQLDMPVEEFIQHYPDLAPLSLRFTGQVSGDTLWHDLSWRQTFSFGYGSMSAVLWESQPCLDTVSCASLQNTFKAVSNDFNACYGPPVKDDPAEWTFFKDPEQALTGSHQEWPRRIWRVGRTQVILTYLNTRVLDPESGQSFPGIGLRVQMSSNVKTSPGVACPVAPMMANMPVEVFGNLYPHLVDQALGFRGPLERQEKIGNVAGNWIYWFDQGSLVHYEWYRGIPDLPSSDPQLFNTLNQTTLALIEQLGNSLGEPSERIENSMSTASERTHLVYQKALWELETEKIEIILSDFDPQKGFGYFMKWRVSQIGSEE